jgi:hypothetical protein
MATTSTASNTPASGPIGLYLATFVVGNQGVPGAPLLQVQALVDAPTGKISGHARITQAIAPPAGNIAISDLTGQIRSLGFGKGMRVVTLTGSYPYVLPPPAIGTVTEPFSATLVLGQDSWAGQGSFSYGGHEVGDVPVRPED